MGRCNSRPHHDTVTLLAALAQSVPVIVRSMPPVTIGHVSEGPDSWLALRLTVGVAAAGIAIGVWTLWKVYDQIRIANKQLTIANEELAAVKGDFKLSQQQFELAQRQFNAVMQGPAVTVTISLGAESAQLFGGQGGALYREPYIDVEVANRGTRVSKDVIVDVFIPSDAFFTDKRLAQASNPVQIEGHAYERWRALGPARLHRSTSTRQRRSLMFKSQLKTITVLWHADDDEYSYPPKGYGQQTLEFKLSM